MHWRWPPFTICRCWKVCVINDGPERIGPRLRKRADGWLQGDSQPGLAAELRAVGFSHVLFVNRDGRAELSRVESVLRADLGVPIVPGVYSLD